MQDSDPTTWPAITWIIALVMSLSGGLINWISHKAGQSPFKIFELMGELFTSGFVGIGIFMLLDSIGQPLGICAASAGVGGHMATRFLFLVERVIESRLMKATDGDIN
jgi:hypothetical protein